MCLELKKLLSYATVHMKNGNYVEQVIQRMARDGSKKLQVIADFDDTLTKFMVNGRRNQGCYGTIRASMPESYQIQAQKYFNQYYPKEIDPNLSREEKFPLMKEWITKVHDLILKNKLYKSDVVKIVRDSTCTLRCNCKEMICNLDRYNVPMLIFSAGIGNIIEEVLENNNSLPSIVKIVSNFLQFDDNGILVSFSEDKIHMLNKNESAIHDSLYFKTLSHRTNVILLGDSIGDLGMSEGVQGMTNLLKIGFLNCNVEERLDEHLKNFDIVIVCDETMNVPARIVDYIVTYQSENYL